MSNSMSWDKAKDREKALGIKAGKKAKEKKPKEPETEPEPSNPE